MKKIIYTLILAVFSVLSVSCEKGGETGVDVNGEWHLTASGQLDITGMDVYVSFTDGFFEIYQKLGGEETGRYYLYEGTYSVAGDIFSGVYDDGTALGGGEYKVSVKGNALTMTAFKGEGVASTYEKKAIPEEVRNSARVPVKSAADTAPLPFL